MDTEEEYFLHRRAVGGGKNWSAAQCSSGLEFLLFSGSAVNVSKKRSALQRKVSTLLAISSSITLRFTDAIDGHWLSRKTKAYGSDYSGLEGGSSGVNAWIFQAELRSFVRPFFGLVGLFS